MAHPICGAAEPLLSLIRSRLPLRWLSLHTGKHADLFPRVTDSSDREKIASPGSSDARATALSRIFRISFRWWIGRTTFDGWSAATYIVLRAIAGEHPKNCTVSAWRGGESEEFTLVLGEIVRTWPRYRDGARRRYLHRRSACRANNATAFG